MYTGNGVDEHCTSLEDKIVHMKKVQKVDKRLLKAMDNFADFHGDYSLQDLDLLKSYGNLVRAIKVNSKDIDSMIKKQGGKKT